MKEKKHPFYRVRVRFPFSFFLPFFVFFLFSGGCLRVIKDDAHAAPLVFFFRWHWIASTLLLLMMCNVSAFMNTMTFVPDDGAFKQRDREDTRSHLDCGLEVSYIYIHNVMMVLIDLDLDFRLCVEIQIIYVT